MYKIDNYFNPYLQKVANNFLKKIEYGSIYVQYPSKKIIKYSGNKSGYNAQISLNNYRLFLKLFKKGSIGFAESYMDGDFESSNLLNLLLFANQNEANFLKNKKAGLIYNYLIKFKHYLNNNTKPKSKKNIKYHYDLGNNFYKYWLDDSMTYSSALFHENENNLHQAQINKYKGIAEPMQLNENSTLLEIGCGWGGFSTYIAKNYGSKIRAITISKEQFEFTSKKIFTEGLNEKIKIEMKDYRDISEKFTNIASIEMFEAVGKKYWHTFFNKIKNSLLENGIASFQIISISDEKVEYYQNNPDFIQQYIFPGGVLPSKAQLKNLTTEIGLGFEESLSFKKSYAKTLNLWNKKFQSSWSSIEQEGFNIRFKKMWEYYLSYCEAGFLTGATDVSQFIIKR